MESQNSISSIRFFLSPNCFSLLHFSSPSHCQLFPEYCVSLAVSFCFHSSPALHPSPFSTGSQSHLPESYTRWCCSCFENLSVSPGDKEGGANVVTWPSGVCMIGLLPSSPSSLRTLHLLTHSKKTHSLTIS